MTDRGLRCSSSSETNASWKHVRVFDHITPSNSEAFKNTQNTIKKKVHRATLVTAVYLGIVCCTKRGSGSDFSPSADAAPEYTPYADETLVLNACSKCMPKVWWPWWLRIINAAFENGLVIGSRIVSRNPYQRRSSFTDPGQINICFGNKLTSHFTWRERWRRARLRPEKKKNDLSFPISYMRRGHLWRHTNIRRRFGFSGSCCLFFACFVLILT